MLSLTFNVPTYKLWWQENGQERHSVATSEGYSHLLAHNGSGKGHLSKRGLVLSYNIKSWIVINDISPSNYKLPERQARIIPPNSYLENLVYKSLASKVSITNDVILIRGAIKIGVFRQVA